MHDQFLRFLDYLIELTTLRYGQIRLDDTDNTDELSTLLVSDEDMEIIMKQASKRLVALLYMISAFILATIVLLYTRT